jgi:hypothetical protein
MCLFQIAVSDHTQLWRVKVRNSVQLDTLSLFPAANLIQNQSRPDYSQRSVPLAPYMQ